MTTILWLFPVVILAFLLAVVVLSRTGRMSSTDTGCFLFGFIVLTVVGFLLLFTFNVT